MSTPMVADLDDDGIADIIVNRGRVDGENFKLGELLALDGRYAALRTR